MCGQQMYENIKSSATRFCANFESLLAPYLCTKETKRSIGGGCELLDAAAACCCLLLLAACMHRLPAATCYRRSFGSRARPCCCFFFADVLNLSFAAGSTVALLLTVV